MKIKRMNIKEFRELGYLQELNRQFLHPLGLALEVIVDDNEEERLGGIWDYREDEEGIHYNLKGSNDTRREAFKKKAQYIEQEWEKRAEARKRKLGFIVEPID